jgi:methylphosphotriester-DNA--protein-cysteine methyltransferase
MLMLRAPDDERADQAFLNAVMADVQAKAQAVLPVVTVGVYCGCGARLMTATRCLLCETDHEWAESNRAFCSWVHRDAVGRA